MPHRVSNFFRSRSHWHDYSHSNILSDLAVDHQPLEPWENSCTESSKPRPSPPDRTRSSLNMPDSAIKRLSLTGLHSPRMASRSQSQHHPPDLSYEIESPPLVFYGVATASTGALLSGQLKINVRDDAFPINNIKMRLVLEVTRKRPFHAHCPECAKQSTDLTTWDLLESPVTLKNGLHSFPFSFLLPGHLPASMKGSLTVNHYSLRATVTPMAGEPLKHEHTLDIKRAVNPPSLPHHSTRVFPPTNITAQCDLPSIIHPIGEFKISMRLDGVVKRNPDGKTQNNWKVKRLSWRLEETQSVISPACAKHALKLGAGEDVKKGTPHQDVRTIGADEIKSGWKSDYTTPDGSVEVEFPFSIRPDSRPVCDLKTEDGTHVSHILIVEMIVADEFAPIKNPTQATPSGAARVLRMHFNIMVTERSGLGISWDEEQPPLYENVPASPPGYVADLQEPIPDYEDLSPLDTA
ncbi:hypothetical protein B7494_g1431 [Chlorociboria aeruginascens]|nr:hypothetical protein B7494_g1431 [Chlorociboria aeruginascens]